MIVNNIVDQYANLWDKVSITAGYLMISEGGALDVTDLTINNNLIWKTPAAANWNGKHIMVGRDAGAYSGAFTAADFNTQYSTTNYANSDNGLYLGEAGADQYITDGTFVVSGATTIANGGLNSAHPYLSGISIPSYVGATDPLDNTWVAGVLAINVEYLTSQTAGSTPSWVLGSGVSGTIILGGCTESEIVTGGKTIVVSIAGTTLVATFGADNAITTAFIQGLDSAQSEAAGWNAEVRDKMTYAAVTRTDANTATIILPATAAYQITSAETITHTIPATSTEAAEVIVATPTFVISAEYVGAEAVSAVYNASGPSMTYSASGITITAP